MWPNKSRTRPFASINVTLPRDYARERRYNNTPFLANQVSIAARMHCECSLRFNRKKKLPNERTDERKRAEPNVVSFFSCSSFTWFPKSCYTTFLESDRTMGLFFIPRNSHHVGNLDIFPFFLLRINGTIVNYDTVEPTWKWGKKGRQENSFLFDRHKQEFGSSRKLLIIYG